MKPQQSLPDLTVREDRIDDGSRPDSVLGVEVSQFEACECVVVKLIKVTVQSDEIMCMKGH